MIEAITLWNEPNNLSHWDFEIDPDWAQYAEMVQLASARIRSLAPRLPLVLGGISPIDPHFIRLLRSYGTLDAIDAVAVHGFPLGWNHWKIDEWPAKIAEIEQVAQRPTWVTEVGVSSFGADEVQVFGLRRTLELLRARAPRVYWYSLFDLPQAWGATTRHKESEGSAYYRHFHMGLIRADGCPKPALDAFDPAFGICQWFHFADERLADAVAWLHRLGKPRLRTGISWADWHRPGALEWFDYQMDQLREFDTTITLCFTPPSHGQRPCHTSDNTFLPISTADRASRQCSAMTEHVDAIILGLLVATAGLVMLANRLRVPYPVFLLLGGLALGFTPGVPSIELPPDLVLLIFLPPILYAAACLCSPRDLRANLKPITLLATALVALTTVSVAAVSHMVIGLPWGAAFVLGAVVSPTDPTAATCIAGRLGVSRQIVTIIEGESLVNDAAALLLYHVARGAVVYGGFSLLGTAGEFVLYGLGGTAIGLAVGWLIARVRRHVKDRLVEITISLFTSYAAYIPAQALGASGVLAAVAAGLYLGWYAPLMTAPRSRLQMSGVWEVLPFLLNSVLFILIGLQLPSILDALPEYSMLRMFLYGALISLVVIGTRLLWMFPMTYFHFPVALNHRLRREHHPVPPWQELAIVGYTGMRGGVSLAAALAIPFTTQGGAAFPGRDLILFLTFCVILFTLVPQGLSLPLLIRRLGLASSEEVEAREETEARLGAAEAALARLDELKDADGLSQDTSACLRDLYEYRRRRFAARGAEQAKDDAYENDALAFQRFRLELLTAERAALLRLRSEGRISDEVRRRVERELDLEETRLEV